MSQAGTALEASMLEPVLDAIADGVLVRDRSGGYAYANATAVRLLGFSSLEEFLGCPPEDMPSRLSIVDESGRPVPNDELPGYQALSGRETTERVLCYRALATGEERWVRAKAIPIRDGDGKVLQAVTTFRDITGQREAALERERLLALSEASRQRSAFLAEASETLLSSLDHYKALTGLIDLVVPRLADWCTISILESDGEVRQLASGALDPEQAALAHELRQRFPSDPKAPLGPRRVMETGRSELYQRIDESLLARFATNREHLALLQRLELGSAMVVPLKSSAGIGGAMTLVSFQGGRSYDETDLELAEELGRRASLAVLQAQLYRQRVAVARTIQRGLLPPSLPDLPGVEIEARYHVAGGEAEVGGDFYDAFQAGERTVALAIGDVSGRGIENATLSSLCRQTIRTAALLEGRPSRVLATLNDALLLQQVGEHFCTVALAFFYLDGRLILSCGGHPQPILLRSNGELEALECPGMALGLVDSQELELSDREARLHPGDALVFYTDGVIEGARLDEAGLRSLISGLAGADASKMATAVAEAVAAGGEPADDMALLVMRLLPIWSYPAGSPIE